MSKSFRKIPFILVAFILMYTLIPLTVHAEGSHNGTQSEVIFEPNWTIINTVSNWMDIDSSGSAAMTSTISGHSGTTKVTIVANLQRYQNGYWVTTNTWTQSYEGSSGVWMKEYYVYSGYNYRLKTDFYAYVGSQVETTSLISGTVHY